MYATPAGSGSRAAPGTALATGSGFARAARRPVFGYSTKEPEVNDQAMTTTPSGLQYRDEVEGTGATAKSGDQVAVHYTGTLENGRKFDSSRDRGKPFEFALGAGRVIRGWDEGVAGMKVGGRRRLVIPPELGYGKQGTGPIPPNSTLHFDVELLEVR
ncbi:MAG: FKBP-type peptidyl-prolyl cis-trans isomerase [Longimicrobiaceae bacterium]